MHLMEMEDEESEPGNVKITIVNGDFEQRNKYFTDVCKTVVQRLWHTINTNALTVDDGTGPPVFCCGEDLDDGTIACSAGTNMEKYSITFVQMSIRTTSPKIGTAVKNVENL